MIFNSEQMLIGFDLFKIPGDYDNEKEIDETDTLITGK